MDRTGPGTLQVLLIACTLNHPPLKVDATLTSMLLLLLGVAAVIPEGRFHWYVYPATAVTLNTILVEPGQTAVGPEMEAGAGGTSRDTHMVRSGPGVVPQAGLMARTRSQPPLKFAAISAVNTLPLDAPTAVIPVGKVH